MNRIREFRRKMGLTQNELSSILSISQGSLSGYETGRIEPDMDMMVKMSQFFNTTLDELFGSMPVMIETPEIGDIDFALSGEIRDLTDAEKQDVLDYVRFKRAQKARQEAKP